MVETVEGCADEDTEGGKEKLALGEDVKGKPVVSALDCAKDGEIDGGAEGDAEGLNEGLALGVTLGANDGGAVGSNAAVEGATVGCTNGIFAEGCVVGAEVLGVAVEPVGAAVGGGW